ncbi:ring-cleaving dioxygenase [Phreatobacter stygius]|uniref:Ring-cleaving dioxygenase n=1 Tax=Phreatobacter stygius TaxID=1940610 RepID=A0A4D7ATI8_9HYPH|nr:ring-cleaving dioxygenase [Phreatobacter stygius]QCI62831.1 ring-cleaving dioxygenase [Phreatobacter stygius]
MSGIHHVTAISGSAHRNLDFYVRSLGLRFVKKTVNFDDPGTYHLYYGDEAGHPGTILTFFPWEHAGPGRAGVGLTDETRFRVPAGSIDFWARRLAEKGVAHDAVAERFGEPVLAFADPDGMRLALAGVTGAETEAGWARDDIPADHAIRGFHGVTLAIETAAATGAVLTDVFGFSEAGRDGALIRFRGSEAAGGIVDIRQVEGGARGAMGRGAVHHVAFRAADDAAQAEMARKLGARHGLQVTEQKDRQYFRSVYFREPGGVIFEIATDVPGFTVDEPLATLGQDLKLPRFLEARRGELEKILLPLETA